jgi:hypothetical protein
LWAGHKGDVSYASAQVFDSGGDLKDEEWQCWIFEFDKSKASEEVTIYLPTRDATDDREHNASNNTNNFGNRVFWVGSRNGTQFHWDGKIAELAIYDGTLNLGHRRELATYAPDLINANKLLNYWPLRYGGRAKVGNNHLTIGTTAVSGDHPPIKTTRRRNFAIATLPEELEFERIKKTRRKQPT